MDWKNAPLSDPFRALRTLCAEEDYSFPEIARQDRPNPFAEAPQRPGL